MKVTEYNGRVNMPPVRCQHCQREDGWYVFKYLHECTSLLPRWEAHLGWGLLFGLDPGMRVTCLGVMGREWALTLHEWLFPRTMTDALPCMSVSVCPYLR